MNASSRSLRAAVCLLTALLLPGLSAGAQFLPGDIIQSEQINAEQRQQIAAVVDAAMMDLINGDAKAMSEARKKMLNHLGNPSGTVAFQDAYSELVSAKMDRAVNHDSTLVRMNAMIVLSRMTDDGEGDDEGSMKQIALGVEDSNVAVQRWAFEAMRSRVATWNRREQAGNGPANLDAKLGKVIERVNDKLNQDTPPNPIVVDKALMALLEVNTPEARSTLVGHLNSRVALHAEDADLSYAGEQGVIERLASSLALERPFDQDSATGLNRAAFRYARLIVDQAKAGAIGNNNKENAMSMLNQCLASMGQVAAGARVNDPAGQDGANGAIQNEQWDALDRLLADWAVILRSAPFGIANDGLAVQAE